MALTDTEIKKARARQKAYSMADGGGLYLWVTTPGGKLWRWSYRFSGKRKLMTLGRYPDISLADARDRHGDARKQLAKGVDPMAQRKAEKTAEKSAVETSFQSVVGKWLEHWRHERAHDTSRAWSAAWKPMFSRAWERGRLSRSKLLRS